MAIEIPNLTEAQGIFAVDPIAGKVSLISGSGFALDGVYNGVGDYSVFLSEPRANKIALATPIGPAAALSLTEEPTNLRRVDVGVSGGAGGAGSEAPFVWGANSIAAAADTRFLFPGGADTLAETTVNDCIWPSTGIFRGIHAVHNLPAGNGNLVDYEILVGGTATGVTVSLASTGSVASAGGSAGVTEGDLVSLRAIKPLALGSSPNNVYVTTSFTQTIVPVPSPIDIPAFMMKVENMPILG